MSEASKKLSDLTQEQRDFILDYLQANFIPTQSINEHQSAYGLKQKFTREHFYVTQEQFIQAMEQAGFRVKPLDDGNARFNISKRSPYFKQED